MHGYIEKNIPENLSIQSPIETKLTVYAPINFGSMKMIKDKTTGKRRTSWLPASADYKPNWDIGNLALVWLKSLDDVLIKKGILPDDTVEYLQRTTYEFIPVSNFRDRKLVYKLKTIKIHFSKAFSYKILDDTKSHKEWSDKVYEFIYSKEFMMGVSFEEYIQLKK
jgi:hypothetical protein